LWVVMTWDMTVLTEVVLSVRDMLDVVVLLFIIP
jgi:hypothetical protein